MLSQHYFQWKRPCSLQPACFYTDRTKDLPPHPSGIFNNKFKYQILIRLISTNKRPAEYLTRRWLGVVLWKELSTRCKVTHSRDIWNVFQLHRNVLFWGGCFSFFFLFLFHRNTSALGRYQTNHVQWTQILNWWSVTVAAVFKIGNGGRYKSLYHSELWLKVKRIVRGRGRERV